MGLIGLISFRHDLGFGDGRRASAVAVHLLGVPVDIVANAFLQTPKAVNAVVLRALCVCYLKYIVIV